MKWLIVLLAVLIVGCAAPKVTPPPTKVAEAAETEAPEVQGAAGGSGEENLNPAQLTGLPGIDQAQDLDIRILDARGNGQLGGVAIPTGKVTQIAPGQWMLTDTDSEYEITLRSNMLPDGIVRLSGLTAFLVEPPLDGELPRFRLFGGKASFYLPHLALGQITVLTPAGPLVTRGAVFTVTVSPDSQVLITCREGSVFLTGSQNAVAQPGQVVVADRLGRGRVYAMTPSEATVFTDRWLKVMTEEAAPVVAATLPRRLAAWKTENPKWNPEDARFNALWFREARTVVSTVPGPDIWYGPLKTPVQASAWTSPPRAPGLLGELP